MAEIKKMGYCVNGEWKESKAEKYMDVTDSSTGEVIAQVPCCTPDEVEEAIASAQAAFPEWSSLSLAKRQQYMFRWRDVLYAHKEELSVLCAKELGKNIKEARGDVQKAIEPTEEACALPTMIQGDAAMQVTTGYDTATYRKPLGVTAGIVPMNFPAMIPWGWMVPLSIACGNTVVLKASSQTPLTSMRIMELFYTEGGFPKGVVNLVTCSRVEADILLTDERVKAVTFVGTTGVGKQVYSKAAAHGKRVQAQCEAKNHALVLEDCNLEATVNAIINSTYGCAGMRCMALPVVCVQDSIADEFVSLLKKKAEAMKQYGDAARQQMELDTLKVYFEQLPKIAEAVAKGYMNVDSIKMFGGDSSKLAGDIMTTVTQVTDGIKESTGLDINEMLAKGFAKEKAEDTKPVENVEKNDTGNDYQEV
mgnify:CR=1 FL=1